MELDKIIDSFEKLCYKIILDIILLPKTILKLYIDHKFSYNYVIDELAKKDNFKNYISPIKLTLYTIIFLLLVSEQSKDFPLQKIPYYYSLSIFEKSLILFLIINSLPIIITSIICFINKVEISEVNLKKPLFIILYCFSYLYLPLFLFAIPLIFLNFISIKSGFNDIKSIIFFLIFVATTILGIALSLYSFYKFIISLEYSIRLLANKSLAFSITLFIVTLYFAFCILISNNY